VDNRLWKAAKSIDAEGMYSDKKGGQIPLSHAS
jgi:hypothetical protein